MTRGTKTVLSLVGVSYAAIAFLPALAQQDYPARPIRVIYPFAPGSVNEGMARLLSQHFTEAWGQTAVVENRTGAGGTIGTDLVARSAPDGYALLISTALLAVNATLFPKLPVDHLSPVSQINSGNIVIAVHPLLPVRNLKALLALANARPNALNFGSNGTGTTSHLAVAWLQQIAGARFTHVPYKGTSPALAAILGGEVAKALQHPAAQKLVEQCADLQFVGSTPAEFTAHFKREIDKYAKIIKMAGIKPEA